MNNTLVLVYGNEPYLVDQHKKQVVKEITLPEMNVLVATEFTDQERQFCLQAPFLDEKKILLLSMDKLKLSAELKNYLENPTQTVIFIYALDIDKRTNDFKRFPGEKVVYDKVPKETLDKFILGYIKKNNCDIKPDTYRLVLERLNYYADDINLYSVKNCLRSLCMSGGEISRELVMAIVPDNSREHLFELMNMIAEKKYAQLFKEAQLILQNKDNNVISVLSLLLRSYRLVFKSLATGASMKDLGVRAQTTLPRMSLEQANQAMDFIQGFVNSVKQGLCPQSEALKVCLAKLCEISNAK